MSTYVYLECLDHDPPLRADSESGQHLSDLPQIRADIAARDALLAVVAASEWGDVPDMGYFRNATARFLVSHPRCRIGIVDEYGDRHALVEPNHTGATTPESAAPDEVTRFTSHSSAPGHTYSPPEISGPQICAQRRFTSEDSTTPPDANGAQKGAGR